jgi:hypothetical protein
MKQIYSNLSIRICAVILVASFLASWFGFGTALQSSMTAPLVRFNASGIDGDRWVQSAAKLEIPGLTGSGNALSLMVSSWRAPGREIPLLNGTVCGAPFESRALIPGAEVIVPLTGSCEPRLVELSINPPYIPGGSDSRSLGVQVDRWQVNGLGSLPIIDPLAVIESTLAIALLAIAVYLLIPLRCGGLLPAGIALLIAVVSGVLIAHAPYYFLRQPTWLWGVLFAVTLGALTAQRIGCNAWLVDERQSTPAQITVIDWCALIIIVAAAFWLRASVVTFGLPYPYHPDEIPKVNAVTRMIEGNTFDPNYFLHPSLLLYLTYGMSKLVAFVDVGFDTRSQLFLSGRLVSVLAGTLSVLLLFFIARRLYAVGTGLIAAAMLAFFPLHVTCSRYLKEDALLCFLLLATILLVVKAVDTNNKKLLYIAGFVAGLSASAKYSGLLTAAVLFAAPFLKTRSLKPDMTWARHACIAALLVPLGFLIATPFSILNHTKFLSDFNYERKHMLRGHTQLIDAWSQYWMYHFSRSVVPGMTVGAALLGCFAAGMLLWRRRIEDLFIVGMILFFYLPAEWVKAKPAPQPERYILPCLLFFACGLGEVFRAVWESRYRMVAPLGAALVIGAVLLRSWSLAAEIPHDTRIQAATWLKEHAPYKSEIYLDWQPYNTNLDTTYLTPVYFLRENLMTTLTTEHLKNSGKRYLVLSSLFYDRYYDKNGDARARARFDEVRKKFPIAQEFISKEGTYGFHNPRLTIFDLQQVSQ